MLENDLGLELVEGDNCELTIVGTNFSGLSEIPEECGGFNITKIGEKAFADRPGFYKLTIPATVTHIGSSAFKNCSNLYKVSILNPDVEFGKNVFSNCMYLSEIDFFAWKHISSTSQIHSIVSTKFDAWDSISDDEKIDIIKFIVKRPMLKYFCLFSNNFDIVFSILQKNSKLCLTFYNRLIQHHINAKNSTITPLFLDYKIKNYTTQQIDDYKENFDLIQAGLKPPTLAQFKESWNVKKVKGKYNITGYFANNSKEVIPNCTADGHCFGGLNRDLENDGYFSLTELVIEADIDFIGDGVFFNSKNLTSIILPNSLKKIGNYAFEKCSNLTHITIPENVTTIGFSAFANCTNLKEIVIPNSVTKLDDIAFDGCRNLSKVTLSNNLSVISVNCFSSCTNLKEIVIPASVKEISHYAFRGCYSLQSITFLGDKPSIGFNAFQNTRLIL